MKSYIRDDIDFLDHLPTKVDFDSTFISLNVTFLYTNITHDTGIEAIAYWIENYLTYLIDTRFTKEFIIEGLLLVLKNNCLKFDNKIFHQLIGTTMGSNVSVIYAILFEAYLELQLYSNIRDIYPCDYAEYIIHTWKRYIDDCFIIWNNRYELQPFYLMISNLDLTIKFTKEDDTKELPFLDITIIKNHDKSITMDIFYKKTLA